MQRNRPAKDSLEMTPQTVAVLEALLRAKGRMDPPGVNAPDVAEIVRYLCGALSTEAAGVVEQGLVQHSGARQRLRRVRDCLDALQALPWAQVAEAGRAGDFTAEVANAWLALTTERLSAAPIAPLWWSRNGWAVVRQQVAEGLVEAHAAWAAFLRFGEQFRTRLETPRAALARGAGEAGPEGQAFGDYRLVPAAAEIAADGSLYVAVEVRDASNKPTAAASGQRAGLALRVDGEVWPVASGAVEGDRVEWVVPGFGVAVGVPAGALPPECLRVTLGEAVPLSWAGPRVVPAEVLDAAGQPTSAPAASIELQKEPRWTGGQLEIALTVPAPTRAAYADHRLQLTLVISPHNEQHLGQWPVSDWGKGPRELRIACPGSADVTISFASILNVRLLAPDSG